MWTTKEVLIISIATGLVFSFATIYSQRKFQSYIETKVTEKTGNPLLGLVPQPPINNEIQQHIEVAQSPSPIHEPAHNVQFSNTPVVRYHVPPDGAGSRWTPLPIS